MRYFKIILLHFESIIEHRLRSLVWFFTSMVNPLIILIFWAGIPVSNRQNINSYYLLLIVASALLSSHIEEDVADYDIRQGDLVRYLIKPFPYYWIKFIEEIPYRVLQGFYGIIALVIINILFKNIIEIHPGWLTIEIGIIAAVLAFFMSFTYKMCLGMLAFWFKQIRGITQLMEIISIIFAGFIIPIDMFPAQLKTIAYFLPFSYMIYFPVKIFQGGLAIVELKKIIVGQLIWLTIFIVINRFEWKQGIKTFTAIGQ